MDSFVVSTIAILNQTEHVLCCLELERSRLLATGRLGGNIKVWDIQKKVPEYLITLQEFDDLKPAETKKTAQNAASLILPKSTETRQGIVKMIYTTQSPGLLLSLGFENFIKVWSPDTSLSKSFIGKLEGHTSIVKDMVFISDSMMAISVDEYFSIRVWDVRKLETIQTIKEDR